MRLVHRFRRGGRVVEAVVDVEVDDLERPVRDLVRVLDPDLIAPIEPVIDGAPVTADSPLSVVALCEGSLVDTTGEPAATRPPARAVAVVGGLRAGVVVDADQPVIVGRGPGARLRLDDPALCGRHLRFCDGRVDDLGSRNGTAIDGHPVVGPAPLRAASVVRAGFSRFRMVSPVDDRPLAVIRALGRRGGLIPFNRPPRAMPSVMPPTIAVPGPAPEPPASEPLSIAGIVLPVVAGAVVAVLFSPFMAVFAALGPVLTVGTWWERRRRARGRHREDLAAFAAALSEVDARLASARVDEIVRRRSLCPDPAEVARRGSGPSVRLWERRPDHADAHLVGVGTGDEAFAPALVPDGDEPAAEVVSRLADLPPMPDVPLPVELSPGRTMGVVGDLTAARAVARSLVVQMATHHGPADLSIVVGADRPSVWSWARWLPHTADHVSGRRGKGVLATDDLAAATEVLAEAGARTLLAVLDGADPLQGRATVGRVLLSGDTTAAVVIVPDEHRLPGRCDTVVRVDEFGRIAVLDLRAAGPARRGLAWGLGPEEAAHTARRMARLDDPELPLVGAGVPDGAALVALLGVRGDDPAEIEERWRRTDDTADLRIPIGADADGAVVLDLVADGPHVLVGGTTGSGKSELLRSMVAALAATADPAHVAVVLIDYKGGAAFDCCADLPHVAGLVTDLDEDLAARAMRCLEAELRHRERRLRAVGADSLAAFRGIAAGRDDLEPLPRLVVVVDEFASLVADLPDFVTSLVGIAQRGRSLGVHMVLATQRPAGVVTDDIRANTGCRVALRVTDRNDSIDVIDAPDAATILRSRPGRAVARFGPGELVPFQAAQVTARSADVSGIRVGGAISAPVDDGAASDLEGLVAAIQAAHRARGDRRPRSPWPPALPAVLRRTDQPRSDWLLVDDPDAQTQRLDGWSPDDGHLVVVGGPGTGATSTLAAAALAVVGTDSPDRPHLHVVDLDRGSLGSLAGLPGAGTIVGPAERTRRGRLLRWLDDEVTRRRALSAKDAVVPRLLVVIDDLGGLARAHDPVREAVVHERLARVWADGPGVGVTMAVSVRRSFDLPPALMATAGTVLVHRVADQSDALRFGVTSSTERFPPGRAIRVGDGALVQVIDEPGTLPEAVAARAQGSVPSSPTPHDVGELGADITPETATPTVTVDGSGAELRVAVGDRDLTLTTLRLHPGEHALVLGPARSGRTTTLVTMALAAGEAAVVVGEELARRSGVPAVAPEMLMAVLARRGPTLVLVDDALAVSDPDGALARVAAGSVAGVHLVVAARPDRYRSAYGHWGSEIKGSRLGLLLRPEPLDGDLLGMPFPARLDLPPLPGRGMLVADGRAEVVQVVRSDGQSAS